MRCLALAPGAATVALATPDELLEAGAVPSSLIFGLADLAASFALHTVLGRGDLHSTVELELQLLRPGRGELRAEAIVLRAGVRLAFAEARVRDEAGQLCGFASGTWSVARDHPGALLKAP